MPRKRKIKIKFNATMKDEMDNFDHLFYNKEQEDWDTAQLPSGHHDRFKQRLTKNKPKRLLPFYLSIAAMLLLFLGLAFHYAREPKTKEYQFASQQNKQTDSIFSVIITSKLNEIKDKKSPENEKIIADAMKQMKQLDNDYDKIIIELQKNGENKIIIAALISNLETRILFLKEVLQHIETNEHLISLRHEETT